MFTLSHDSLVFAVNVLPAVQPPPYLGEDHGNSKRAGLTDCCKLILSSMLPDLRLNDRLRLRKQHPCGSYEWTVTRLGADIGLECKGCGRRVLLTRRELAKRLKANLTEHKDEPSNS
jgi:hypothetical protein